VTVTFQGSLSATVSPAGKLTVTFRGRSVTTLKAGRYTVTVTDRSAKSGFALQEIRQPAIAITGAGFVGKRSRSIDLTSGQWFFYPTFIGKKTYFSVIT